MVIRASEQRLEIREIPIELHPRGGTSKLSPFRDGARALRLMLTHSPAHLFLLPGALMAVVGVLLGTIVLANLRLFGRQLYLHTLIAGSLLVIVGAQLVALGVCGQAYQVFFMNAKGNLFDRLRSRLRFPYWLLAGGVLAVAGLVLDIVVFTRWAEGGFGRLSEERLAILASTLLILGVEVVFAALFLSLLGLRSPVDGRARNL